LIQILGMNVIPSSLWSSNSNKRKIIEAMQQDPNIHYYQSIHELAFELTLRNNIISSAQAMNDSQARFEVFSTSRCNPQYWILTSAGGFQLRPDVLPSEAIEDIYKNSSLYGFECATAKMIIYYHAVLKSINRDMFNRLFQSIYLYSWHADTDLGIHSMNINYSLPGDVIYFNNPDVSPQTPWWRGENAVVLGDGTFFGHGIGIKTAKEIIDVLNGFRNPGSTISAYQTTNTTRPAFLYLSQFSVPLREINHVKFYFACIHHNQPSIAYEQYSAFLHDYYVQSI
jgi:protein-glutamine gamma-glutamyltransferase